MSIQFQIIVPCYQQAHLLPDAIGSLRAQSYEHWRAVIVNDGSPDGTQDIAKQLIEREPRRLLYVEQSNAGLSAARNTGIAAAKGDWLVFLDADDLVMPEFLQRHVEVIAAGGVDVTCCGAVDTTLEGAIIGERPPPDFRPDPLRRLLGGNVAVVHSFVVRRTAVIDVGGFDEKLRALEDWDLWLRLAARGYLFRTLQNRGAVYRRYPESMACDVRRMYRNRLSVTRKSRQFCRNEADTATLAQSMQRFRRWYLRKEAWTYLKARPLAGSFRLFLDVLRDPYVAQGIWEVCQQQWNQVYAKGRPEVRTPSND